MIRENQNPNNKKDDKKRYLSIDVFKGLSVILMVFANAVGIYDNVPSWSKHAVDFGLTYVDVIAPFFVFMMALNFKISYKKRLETFGREKTYLRFIRRYIIFIILGFFFSLGFDEGIILIRWGTFQVLGLSGLILLPIIEFKAYKRLILALILMLTHQLILFTNFERVIYEGIEGGFFGSLSWGSMMILSSVLSEGLEKKEVFKYFLIGGLICLVLGIISGIFWGISRAYITLPYILVCVGIGSIVYFTLYYIFEIWGIHLKFFKGDNFLSVIGKNAFFLYLIDLLITYPIYVIVPTDAPWLLILSIGLIYMILIEGIAYYMNNLEMFIII